ncbi:DUF4124 domain-containing protein, partial [Acinetobacter baumannii]|uniref:DUF4124 domain-containing protein n=1 Tax=Acinetobacter baumannii TaxID=470 RepID=UPI00189B9570|nr:DUF4124 domain-containing protein [Acinetobacter baumannii]
MNFRFRPLEGNTSKNRFRALAPALLLTAFACSCLFRSGAQAQEIYKWTDANGKVHYGDRAAAPEHSKKIAVSTTAPPRPPAVPASSASAQR